MQTPRSFSFSVLLVLVLTGSMTVTGCDTGSAGSAPVARDGRLDLGAVDLARGGPLALRGEWEFLRGEFMSPAEYLYWTELEFKRAKDADQPPRYLTLPGDWERQALPGVRAGTGFGTFILRLSGLPLDETLGLRVGRVGAAYRLYLVPAAHLELVREKEFEDESPFRAFLRQGFADEVYSVPHMAPALGGFVVTDPELYLILHVANQDAARGGLVEPIYLGLEKRLRRTEDIWRALHFAFFGFLGALFLVHLGRLLRGVNPADIFFILLSVLGLGYLFCLSHRAEDFFPGFNRDLFYLFRRTEAVSRALFVAVWLSYPLVLKRIQLPERPALIVLWGFTAIYVGLALFASLRTTALFREYLDPVTAGVFAYSMAGILLATRGGDYRGLPYLLSLLLVGGAFFLDVVHPDYVAGRLPLGLFTTAVVAALSSNLFDGRSLGVARSWRAWMQSRRGDRS